MKTKAKRATRKAPAKRPSRLSVLKNKMAELKKENSVLSHKYSHWMGRAADSESRLRLLKATRDQPPSWISAVWDAQNRVIERFDNAVAIITRVAARDGTADPEDLVPFFPDKVLEEEWVRRAYRNLLGEAPPADHYQARNIVITKIYEKQARTT